MAIVMTIGLVFTTVLGAESTSSCRLFGTVSDTTGGRLPEVTVLVEPLQAAEITTESGEFCFADLPPGNYRVGFLSDRFEESWETVAVDTEPVEVEVTLVFAFREEVVVTGTRTERRLDSVPVRTELIGRQLIESSGARNLAEAVEFTTGIRVESNCQNCNFSQIRLLGLQGAYSQILIDGQPTVSSLAQVYGVEQIPTRMIERIEVVKGGGSAVYGPGSVGGVVNIIPRRPTRTSGYLESRGAWLSGQPGFSFSGAYDWVAEDRETYVTIFGQRDRVAPVDLSHDGFTEVAERKLATGGFRMGHHLLENRAQLTFDLNRIEEDRRGGNRLDLPPQEADLAEWILTKRTAGGLRWRHALDESFDYQVAVSMAQTNRDTYYGAGRDPNAFGRTANPLWVVDGQANHFFESHILTWGGQASFDRVEDSQPAYDRDLDESYANFGLFLQDDWFLAPGWELLYGLRVDKHSAITRPIVSPRAALKFSPRPDVSIRTSVARGFRPPQTFDEDLHISLAGGEGQVIRSSPSLREETSTNYMLGAEWTPMFGQGNALIEANLFLTRITDLHNVQEADLPETSFTEFERVNFGSARVYGAELNFGWGRPGVIEFQTGYVEQRARFGQAEPDFGSVDFFRTPNRYGVASVNWFNPGFVDLFLGAKFTGSMKVPHYAGFITEDRLEESESFVTLDFSISKALSFGSDQRVLFTIGSKNLTNAYQNQIDQGVNRDSDFVYGPRFPRSFYVSTSIDF